MKKIKLGLLAALLAVVFLSFTRKESSHDNVNGYWFQYNTAGTAVLDDASKPALTSTDPFGCTGTITNCSAEYSSFTTISPTDYAPSGTLLQIDKKN